MARSNPELSSARKPTAVQQLPAQGETALFGLRRFFDEISIEINSANISQTRKRFWIWILLALSLFNYGFNTLPTVFFGARTIKFELRGVATFVTTIAKRGDNKTTKMGIDKHLGLISTLIKAKLMSAFNALKEIKAMGSNLRNSSKKTVPLELNEKHRYEVLSSTNSMVTQLNNNVTTQGANIHSLVSEVQSLCTVVFFFFLIRFCLITIKQGHGL